MTAERRSWPVLDGIKVLTAQDVKSPLYQRELRLHQLRQELLSSDPFDQGYLLDHVERALITAGYPHSNAKAFKAVATGVLESSLPDRLAGRDKAFYEAFDPSSLVEQIKEKIDVYREASGKAIGLAPMMMEEQRRRLTSRLGEETRNHYGLLLEEREIKEGGRTFWEYAFEPAELLRIELNSLSVESMRLGAVYKRQGSKEKDRLAVILSLLKTIRKHGELHSNLIDPWLNSILIGRVSVEEMEITPRRYEAGRVRGAYEQWVAGSDLWVDFRSPYLILKHSDPLSFQQHVSLEQLSETDQRYTEGALRSRQAVRDFLESVFKASGEVTVNGRWISFTGTTVDNKFFCKSSAKTLPNWLVNLLPYEVICGDDKLYKPEDWAEEEAKMVSDYRGISLREAFKIPPHLAVSAILNKYVGFWPEELRTKATFPQRLDLLLRVLRHDEWTKLHSPKAV